MPPAGRPGTIAQAHARGEKLRKEAARAEARVVRARLEDLGRLQGAIRLLIASRSGSPLPLVLQEVRQAVSQGLAAIATQVVADMRAAQQAGAAVVEEMADVLDVALPVGEAEEDDLAEEQVVQAIVALGVPIVSAITARLLRASVQPATTDQLPAVLGAIGTALKGSPVFGRPAEQLAGNVSANLGAAYGRGTERRARAAERAGVQIRKRWVAEPSTESRKEHLAAARRYAPGGSPGPIRFGEDFQVGIYRTPYPRGPGLPGGHKVHCRCRSVPVVVEVPRASPL